MQTICAESYTTDRANAVPLFDLVWLSVQNAVQLLQAFLSCFFSAFQALNVTKIAHSI
jgi:hypothetical protein